MASICLDLIELISDTYTLLNNRNADNPSCEMGFVTIGFYFLE